jgi:Phasin protein
MAENENQAEKAEQTAEPNPVPPEFAAIGKKRLDELVAAQTQQFEKLRDISRNWFDRMQFEATLASELAARLTAVRSVPEVATAYQEWATRHMEMAAEDAKRILTDAQKLAETGAQLLSGGLRSNGHGISS